MVNTNKEQFQTRYFIDKLVYVIKEYEPFGLRKVRYCDDNQEFYVDKVYLSDKPVYEKSISISLLGGI